MADTKSSKKTYPVRTYIKRRANERALHEQSNKDHRASYHDHRDQHSMARQGLTNQQQQVIMVIAVVRLYSKLWFSRMCPSPIILKQNILHYVQVSKGKERKHKKGSLTFFTKHINIGNQWRDIWWADNIKDRWWSDNCIVGLAIKEATGPQQHFNLMSNRSDE